MNKFEFGDAVFHEEYGTGFVVNGSTYHDSISVIFKGGAGPYWLDRSDLKPIPHPDTERMEWLYRNLLSKNVFGNDHQIQTADDLRDAIDTERYRRENPDPSAFE